MDRVIRPRYRLGIHSFTPSRLHIEISQISFKLEENVANASVCLEKKAQP